MEGISIKTPRLLIRHLKPSDLSDFHVYRSNPEVTKYQGFDVFSMEQAKQFIEDNAAKHFGKADEWVQYGIEHLNTNQLIGDCAIKLHGHNKHLSSK